MSVLILGDVFQVVGWSKLQRLASLAKLAKVSICVDSVQNVQEMSEAAKLFEAKLDVLVEVNVGQDRCGVEPGEAVVQLAKEIQQLPGLNFKGIQAYQGCKSFFYLVGYCNSLCNDDIDISNHIIVYHVMIIISFDMICNVVNMWHNVICNMGWEKSPHSSEDRSSHFDVLTIGLIT